MSQTGVVSWSQTAASNATADSNVNWAEGMAPSQVNDSARAEMASVAKWRDDNAGTLISTGSATAHTLTTNQSFSSLTVLNGQTLRIRFGITNGSAPTLSVDGLAAKAIQIDSATAVTSGAIRANSIHSLTYDNSGGYFIVHSGHSLVEPGRIMESALSAAPPGWVTCDGSALSRTTYADLFANIGTTFGSTDANTFQVPNRTGRVAVRVDASSSTISNATTLGATLGQENHTLSSAEMPVHTHTVSDPGHQHSGSLLTNYVGTWTGANNDMTGGSSGGSFRASSLIINSAVTGISLGNAGSGSSHNNMQPTIAMNFYIKT